MQIGKTYKLVDKEGYLIANPLNKHILAEHIKEDDIIYLSSDIYMKRLNDICVKVCHIGNYKRLTIALSSEFKYFEEVSVK